MTSAPIASAGSCNVVLAGIPFPHLIRSSADQGRRLPVVPARSLARAEREARKPDDGNDQREQPEDVRRETQPTQQQCNQEYEQYKTHLATLLAHPAARRAA